MDTKLFKAIKKDWDRKQFLTKSQGDWLFEQIDKEKLDFRNVADGSG